MRKTVDGVSYAIRAGETLELVGESGCGKTTLGRTVLGLEPANAGTVRARGRDVKSDPNGRTRRRLSLRFGPRSL